MLKSVKIECQANDRTGVHILDDENEELIQAFNRFVDILSNRLDRAAQLAAIAQLESEAKSHFINEEHLMSAVRYPHLDAHQRDHDVFLATLARLGRDLARLRESQVFELVSYLSDWVFHHITVADRRITPYIERRVIAHTVWQVYGTAGSLSFG